MNPSHSVLETWFDRYPGINEQGFTFIYMLWRDYR
jgi:hypothetical protein